MLGLRGVGTERLVSAHANRVLKLVLVAAASPTQFLISFTFELWVASILVWSILLSLIETLRACPA
jgi:hypothetical protein